MCMGAKFWYPYVSYTRILICFLLAELYGIYINASRIIDAMTPLLPLGQFVLLTSPNHQRYTELQKQTNVETLGMPIWDVEELHQLWEFQHKSVVTESEWKDRFNKWGGIPGSISSKGSVTYQQALDDNIKHGIKVSSS